MAYTIIVAGQRPNSPLTFDLTGGTVTGTWPGACQHISQINKIVEFRPERCRGYDKRDICHIIFNKFHVHQCQAQIEI